MVLIELFKNLRICSLIGRNYCTTVQQSTATEAKELGVQFKKWIKAPTEAPRQVWIESISKPEETKVGLLQLHPEVFGTMPRIDVIHQNVIWQQKYRFVSYASTQVWHEIRGGNRKPWPQKGTGRARHGTIRSALFRGGEIIHGPRPYRNRFFMLPYYNRIMGLTSALSIKLAQDDLHIIDSLDIPSTESSFITNLMEERNWGPSVLIIDDTDIIPQNIAIATDSLQHVNLMPVYGLNVFSMMKHDTLVLTTAAVERIEEKILEKLYTANPMKYQKKFRVNQQ